MVLLQSTRTVGLALLFSGIGIFTCAALMCICTLRILILTANELLTDASGNSLLRLIKQSQSLTLLDLNRCRLSLSVKNQLNQAGLARTGLRVET
jgi:hypothetical protein